MGNPYMVAPPPPPVLIIQPKEKATITNMAVMGDISYC
jgi:hypothetical protein